MGESPFGEAVAGEEGLDGVATRPLLGGDGVPFPYKLDFAVEQAEVGPRCLQPVLAVDDVGPPLDEAARVACAALRAEL